MSVRRVLERIGTIRDDLVVDWPDGVSIPDEMEPTAQSVLLEAIRNADKHADPTWIEVTVARKDGNFILEVTNDGVREAGPGTGLGLRLATIDALQHSGIVEFGPLEAGRWHVRLVMPEEP